MIQAQGVLRYEHPQRGFVLVTVLWVLAILTVITLGFGRRSMLDARAAVYSLDHMKTMHMARGAVARGIAELKNKAAKDAVSRIEGMTCLSQPWAKPMNMLGSGEGYYTLGGDAGDGEEFADEFCGFQIRDESSRISINSADEELLARVEGLDRGIIRKINFRRKGDRAKKTPPEPFQTIEELRYFEGIDDDDWFGTGRTTGLRDMLTCWGDGKININTATQPVLECIPDLRSSVIDEIIMFRAGADGEVGTSDDGAFKSLDDIAEQVRLGGDSVTTLRRYCSTNSMLFTITGTATLRQGKVLGVCVATVHVQGPNVWVIKWREEFLES
ncbi:MAG: hypothetical protein GWP08_16605 [Nitrospiraceae bacterium]|nr:hypothetical protein [Nitrospiraceae bacterium]